jgi:hypothetical protein
MDATRSLGIIAALKMYPPPLASSRNILYIIFTIMLYFCARRRDGTYTQKLSSFGPSGGEA